jgi:hypothetical protein
MACALALVETDRMPACLEAAESSTRDDPDAGTATVGPVGGLVIPEDAAGGVGVRRVSRRLGRTSTQGTPPASSPLEPDNKAIVSPRLPWIQGIAPSRWSGWVKMGPAAAIEVGRLTTMRTKTDRLEIIARSITWPSWCDGRRSIVAQSKRGSIRVP